MPVRRKVFRIEEAVHAGRADPRPQHDEYLAELKALRKLIEPRQPQNRDALERARAQIAEVDAYRSELAVIHAGITESRPAMDALDHLAGHGPQLERAGRELDAIVSATEQAAQGILRAAEVIEQTAGLMADAVEAPERQRHVADIRKLVGQIFQACDFQDITGQRAANVLATLQDIEAQVAQLVQIWSRIGEMQPVVFDDGNGDGLLNGPKLAGDAGHASQDEIDAMFSD